MDFFSELHNLVYRPAFCYPGLRHPCRSCRYGRKPCCFSSSSSFLFVFFASPSPRAASVVFEVCASAVGSFSPVSSTHLSLSVFNNIPPFQHFPDWHICLFSLHFTALISLVLVIWTLDMDLKSPVARCDSCWSIVLTHEESTTPWVMDGKREIRRVHLCFFLLFLSLSSAIVVSASVSHRLCAQSTGGLRLLWPSEHTWKSSRHSGGRDSSSADCLGGFFTHRHLT